MNSGIRGGGPVDLTCPKKGFTDEAEKYRSGQRKKLQYDNWREGAAFWEKGAKGVIHIEIVPKHLGKRRSWIICSLLEVVCRPRTRGNDQTAFADNCPKKIIAQREGGILTAVKNSGGLFGCRTGHGQKRKLLGKGISFVTGVEKEG